MRGTTLNVALLLAVVSVFHVPAMGQCPSQCRWYRPHCPPGCEATRSCPRKWSGSVNGRKFTFNLFACTPKTSRPSSVTPPVSTAGNGTTKGPTVTKRTASMPRTATTVSSQPKQKVAGTTTRPATTMVTKKKTTTVSSQPSKNGNKNSRRPFRNCLNALAQNSALQCAQAPTRTIKAGQANVTVNFQLRNGRLMTGVTLSPPTAVLRASGFQARIGAPPMFLPERHPFSPSSRRRWYPSRRISTLDMGKPITCCGRWAFARLNMRVCVGDGCRNVDVTMRLQMRCRLVCKGRALPMDDIRACPVCPKIDG